MYIITLRKSHYKWEKLLNVFVDCSSEKHFSFYCDQLFRCKILSSMLIALETCLIFTFVSVGKILKWNNSKKSFSAVCQRNTVASATEGNKLLVKSVCKTALKSVYKELSMCHDWPGKKPLSFCQSGCREIQNTFS